MTLAFVLERELALYDPDMQRPVGELPKLLRDRRVCLWGDWF